MYKNSLSIKKTTSVQNKYSIPRVILNIKVNDSDVPRTVLLGFTRPGTKILATPFTPKTMAGREWLKFIFRTRGTKLNRKTWGPRSELRTAIRVRTYLLWLMFRLRSAFRFIYRNFVRETSNYNTVFYWVLRSLYFVFWAFVWVMLEYIFFFRFFVVI